MKNRSAYKSALILGAISVTLLLAACVCRPVRVGSETYTTPTTVAEMKATLPQ